MKKLYSARTTNLKPIIQLVLVIVLALSPSFFTYGQVKVDFKPRTSVFTPNKTIYNVKGDFTMLGNTNLTLVNYNNGSNNSVDMKYVDVDNDPNTFNSSSASIKFADQFGVNPDCSNIVYAGLYWTGRSRSANSFNVTKDVKTGNTITRQATATPSIYSGEAIPNTDYTLTVTPSGNTRIFSFTSSGSGNKVDFYYTTGITAVERTLKVSVNNGPQTDLATSSIDNDNAYLSVPFTIFSNSDNGLTINRLRLSGPNRAYVAVRFIETVDEFVQVTKNFDKRKVSIKGPDATTYTQLTANGSDIYYPSGTDENMFSAYVDITDYVKNNGKDGQYHVADIALIEGNGGATGYYGGWGMVVVYENVNMGWKDITVFDGHAFVEGSKTLNHTIDVAGFNSTQNGPVNLKLGVMAGEGDRSISGDYFKIQKHSDNTYQSLSHPGNSTVNFFNSSIQTEGARFPNLLNNTGLDISMFDLENTNNEIIDNNQTSTRFQYGSTQDTYIIFNVTFSVDAYLPESEGLLSVLDINGSTPTAPFIAQPGNEIEYGLEIRNKGTEAIENAKLVIPIPFTAEFVPGSITFNEYDGLFNATAPYFDPNEGATGSIVWDIAFLPLDIDITKLLADVRFKLKTTEDCSILVNNNCAAEVVVLGGYISGTGINSQVDYSLPIIQGYREEGVCEGIPNTDPLRVSIDAEQYIIDNCDGITLEREFSYCSVLGNGVPVSEVQAQFPQGSLFYDSYPVTVASIQYNATNPFPSTIGKTTYYAVPPGLSTCSYVFTIEVTQITSSPSVSNVEYCRNQAADPLTSQASNPDYTVFYYMDNNPSTVGQTSLIPDTSVAGEFTYYASEGPSVDCVNGTRIPIKVTVYNDLSITLDEQINNSCSESNNGSLNISVNGGSNNYTFQWDTNGLQNPGATTEDLTNLPDGTYTVTVSDVDTNCTATASFIITTEIASAVEVTAPADITLSGCSTEEIGNGTLTSLAYSESSVTISTAQFLAEGGTFIGDVITSVAYSDISTGSCPLVVTRTFTVVDACGNSVSKDQIITVVDTKAPILTLPEDITLECSKIAKMDPSIYGAATATDDCGDVDITFVDSAVEGCGNTQVISRTWTATDVCGNSTSDVQTISIVDTTAPTITNPAADALVECDGNGNLNELQTWLNNNGGAQAFDTCSDITWANNYSELTNTCGNTGSVTVTFTVSDACGLSSSTTAMFTIIDNTAPVFVETLPTNTTVECDVVPTATILTATDNCGTAEVTFTETRNEGSCESNYILVRTWTATDACGLSTQHTQTITVQDTKAPTITQAADLTVECDGLGNMTYLENWLNGNAGASASDNCSTVVSWSNNFSGLSDACGATGSATVTFTATDDCGNSSSTTATFTIVDTVAPIFDTLPAVTTIACGLPVEFSQASASDTCSGEDVNLTFEDVTTAGNCEGTYSVSRTWTATDACGNTATAVQTINVQDITPPVIASLPEASTIECEVTPEFAQATATDACGSEVTLTFEDVTTIGECEGNYAITRTWTATDTCGNASTASQTINVQDSTAPALVTEYQSEISISCDNIPTVPSLVFEDACSNNMDVKFNETSTDTGNAQNYVITRTWTVTDACGNEAVYTQTINVSLAVQITAANTDLCNDDDINFDLFSLLSGTFETNGTWSVVTGNATLDGSLFNPYQLELGTYTFKYTLSDDFCTSETLVNITLNDDCVVLPCGSEDVIISRAVTTYTDGKNDFFTVTGVESCGFTVELQIFNRWGAMIFESKNYQNDWNGSSSKGSVGSSNFVPTGTYYYVINLKNSGLKPFAGPIYVATK